MKPCLLLSTLCLLTVVLLDGVEGVGTYELYYYCRLLVASNNRVVLYPGYSSNYYVPYYCTWYGVVV